MELILGVIPLGLMHVNQVLADEVRQLAGEGANLDQFAHFRNPLGERAS